MTNRVQVTCNGSLITANYIGKMSAELLEEANEQIRTYVNKGCHRILYNCMEMEKPEMKLSMLMKKFDSEVGHRLDACATVTQDAATAFMAKIAFVFTPNHHVFYNDLAGAKAWLMSQGLAKAV